MTNYDLIEVSREEFLRRQEDVEHVIAELDTSGEFEDDIVVTHYTDREGWYLGTIRITEDGALHLVPELLDDEEEE